MPFLAKVSDAKWKAAAELEQTAPLDATVQFAVGEAWWKIAENEAGATKTALLVHAGEWYARARPNLTSVLQKELVTKRLNEIAPLKGVAPVKPAGPVNPNLNPSVTQTPPPAKPGEWIDLLEWSEGVDWAPRGIDWNKGIDGKPSRDGISLKPGDGGADFSLPAIIEGDYEMEAEFTQHDGFRDMSIRFPVGHHTMALVFCGDIGRDLDMVGFVDGHWIDGNVTVRRPSRCTNGVRHRAKICVKRNGRDAEFNVDFDERPNYIHWRGSETALTHLGSGVLMHHPAITAYRTNVTFHKVRVRILSGTIRRDVITDADRELDLKNGFVRLVGEKAIAPKVGFSRFVVNQIPPDLGPGTAERLWPLITRDFKVCDDFYGAHAPSRLKCSIPTGAKSFSAIGYNDSSRTAKYIILMDGKPVYDSGVTDIAIVKVEIPAKAALLELVIDPAGDATHDHTYWCYPRFHSVPLDKLSDKMLDGKPGPLKFTIAPNPSVGAQTLTHNQPINTLKAIPLHFRDAQPCDEFLYAHAPSTVTFQVPEGMTRFTAIGYTVRSQSVKYEVWADAKQLPVNGQGAIIPIDVKLPPGTKTIELKINDLGNKDADDSMWCYPRLHRK